MPAVQVVSFTIPVGTDEFFSFSVCEGFKYYLVRLQLFIDC